MSSNSTPGPWIVKGGDCIAAVDDKGHHTHLGTIRKQDAPLAAAAPAMLDALKECVIQYAALVNTYVINDAAIRVHNRNIAAAIAAIAQAEGRP